MNTKPVNERLADLRAQLAQLIAAHPEDADFWPAYASIAEDIQAVADAAGAAVGLSTYEYLEAILVHAGKHQGDEYLIVT